MRGLPSLWNFLGSKQIIFPWVLAGRISNMVNEQWRYRAKDSWQSELRLQEGMQIQMSESDTKMPLELGQLHSQLRPVSLLLSLGLSNGFCLLGTTLSSAYMKQYSERLWQNLAFQILASIYDANFVFQDLMFSKWCWWESESAALTLLSCSHHSEGPNYLHLPRFSLVTCHEPFQQWHSWTSQTTESLKFYSASKQTNIKFCIQFWILNRIQNIPRDKSIVKTLITY